MTTERGVLCPTCDGEEETEHVAITPFTKDGVTTEPHRYAVGPACYRKQWAVKYGKNEKCPV